MEQPDPRAQSQIERPQRIRSADRQCDGEDSGEQQPDRQWHTGRLTMS